MIAASVSIGPPAAADSDYLLQVARTRSPARRLLPATPIGGARPKVLIADPDGGQWIAKLPAPYDGPFSAVQSEAAAYHLARRAGIGSVGVRRATSTPSRATHPSLQESAPAVGTREEFDRLVGIGPSMHAGLRDAAVDLVWPEAAACEGDAVTGYTMPRLPSGYVVRINGKERESALMYAVPKGGPFAPDRVPDPHQRLALITGVARFLDMLHQHDYVYGDISWSNILFRLDPKPTVLVFDIDGVRAVGRRPALAPGALDTIDFVDHASTHGPAGFDSDRFKFALLAYRMLVGLTVSAPLPEHATVDHQGSGLSPTQARRLERLLRRAAGAPGTRPTMREWLDALTAVP